MIKKSILLLALCFASFATAQETPVSSANESTGSNGSVTYSVGLISIKTLEGAEGSVSQGIQIPLEVTQILSINDSQFNNVSLRAYPNPTTDVVRINVGNHQDLSVFIYDIHGKLITKQVNISTKQISLGAYKSGIYLFKILQGNKEIKTFKIIKK
ncbi:T9SS type A sorting domain-containing protein [Kordia sp. TARA_039_SRF]|nr:T9SS type A sorting domain-containing protein [Kordia sp. TARA_039_SRF]